MKLREVYQKLRAEHIVLLRTNGESQKKLQTIETSAKEAEEERMVGYKLSVYLSVFFIYILLL